MPRGIVLYHASEFSHSQASGTESLHSRELCNGLDIITSRPEHVHFMSECMHSVSQCVHDVGLCHRVYISMSWHWQGREERLPVRHERLLSYYAENPQFLYWVGC